MRAKPVPSKPPASKPLPTKPRPQTPGAAGPSPDPVWQTTGGGPAFLRGSAGYVLASFALLIPCYWHSRIQAGDLSSHIYNAWLAQLIESGKLQGLVIVGQTTNVLFDLLLNGLFRLFGAAAAQRLAVSVCVLVFVWGSFSFVSAVSGRRAWPLLPCIAMVAYGWVYHMGLFNFYLSLGLCLFGLALLWNPAPKRIALCIPVFVIAYTAHALPVLWAAGVAALVFLSRRIPERQNRYVTVGALTAVVVVGFAIGQTMLSRWSFAQIELISGADQVNVFDAKYSALFVVLLLLWIALFLRVLRGGGPNRLLTGLPFRIFAVTAAIVFAIPTLIMVPGYQHALVFIAERMSLAAAICVCALVGTARPGKWEQYAIAALALVFFGFLFRDERILNRFEDRLEAAVATLPPMQRVVSAVDDPTLRTNPLTHMIDRACVGRCYSYANYEPSTAQFRIRVTAPNPYVISNYEDSHNLQVGTYVVKERDTPLYQLYLNESGDFLVRSLMAGAPSGGQGVRTLTGPLADR